MRICIDLDGVIADFKKPGETYADVAVIPGAKEKMQALKAAGHYLIISTARHMKSCDGNPSKVIARVGKITLDWLDHHGIPYDEIDFGKPWAQVYLDDNALRFEAWDRIAGDGSSFPRHNETVKEFERKEANS